MHRYSIVEEKLIDLYYHLLFRTNVDRCHHYRQHKYTRPNSDIIMDGSKSQNKLLANRPNPKATLAQEPVQRTWIS